ncbi:chromate efflux transporter [Thalassovita sp.]|jgi:chromate transporter|uniref:chromate efflux transporter n=1 Tax=Thalassovita sp. TaxID=1979401 RepID=UPI003B5AE771
MSHDTVTAPDHAPSLWRLFAIFFKIGCIAWGGYMALVSVVRAEVVEKQRLMSDDEIMEGVALAMVLPGPVAVNVVAFVGNRLAGALGALVCATAVILPSFALMIGFAVAFFSVEDQLIAQALVAGIVPAIAAIILNAALKMGKNALAGPLDWAIAALAAALVIFVGGILMVFLLILGAGLIGILRYRSSINAAVPNRGTPQRFGLSFWVTSTFLLACILLFLNASQLAPAGAVAQMFSTFSGMSLILFGGGYIFIPMLQEAVVGTYGWLADDEFAASIALGQVTPGPILISATFVGYKVAGLLGAFVATVAIFMPPACLIVLMSNQMDRVRNSTMYQAAQKSIRVAVVGMITASGLALLGTLDFSALTPGLLLSLGIFAASLLALIGFKKGEVWVIVMAGALAAVPLLV